MDNLLFYGDNLDVLKQHIKDESVDLIYLDPPFNSNADYNVLFAEQDGTRAAAQIKAFGDTWRWDQAAALAFHEIVESGPARVSQAMQAFRTLLGQNNMLAYLSMMAPRLVELHRVLKPTGSLYLHCDPTASHYLKLLLDGVFGPENFRNEIIWKRTSSHNDARKFADIHDCLFFYRKSRNSLWNPQHVPHNEKYLKSHYNRTDDAGRLYRLDNITRSASMGPRPNLVYEYQGFTPEWGWRVQKTKLEEIDKGHRLYWTTKGTPYLVRYLDEQKGAAMPSIWEDIPPINSQAAERLGYPTQKPEALLERIIKASSNEGDTVLDPFCGCGTTISVAQRLGRKWVGIDITHLAIALIKSRLQDAHGPSITKSYKVVGEPVSLPDARALAHEKDRYQFQYWALGLVGARPLPSDQKKGADKGIDGRLFFHDDAESGKTKQIVFSVKSGKLKPDDIRALGHVVERETAQIGVLISMEEPTQKMKTDAASVGFYKSPWGTSHPRLQILTVSELLEGKKVDMPPSLDLRTFKKAPKAKKEANHKDQYLFEGED